MTMTLDELKEAVADICAGCDSERSLFTNADLGDAIDAAIRERDELRVGRDAWAEQHASLVLELVAARERAVKAEAELAAAQNTIAAQQGTMGALKRKLALAEGELAALKARIAGGWLCGVSNDKCHGNFDAAIYCLPSRFRGKRVRLMVMEE